MQTNMDREAKAILLANDRGGYTIPTEGLYPYQWNWDSAFAALGFAEFDLARAWEELETLFLGQWSDGMVPHIIFHKPDPRYFPGPDVWGGIGPIPSSGITQPPIAPVFARRIYEKNPEVGLAKVKALYPKMVAWMDWFMAWRLDQGAVCTTHPWESGRDNSPDWDTAMNLIDPVDVGEYQRRDLSHVDADMRPKKWDYDRYIWLVNQGRNNDWDQEKLLESNPFRVADPTMTFTVMRAMRDVIALGEIIGADVSKQITDLEVLEAGAETIWNTELGAYDARTVATGSFTGVASNASFLCWYGGLKAERALTRLDKTLAKTPYPVPSHDPDSPRFDAMRYWRGPSWGFMNMLIGLGLEEQGHAQSDQIRLATRRLIGDYGFAEYFNPLTGAPAGGQSFTWTAAVWLTWASPTKEV